MPPLQPAALSALQKRIWEGSLPLEIRLAAADCTSYDQSDPYLSHHPRLAYLPSLLPRLHAFFRPYLINPEIAPHDTWLSFDGLPLKWHYPLGLLYDLFSGASPAGYEAQSTSTSTLTAGPAPEASTLPWRLTIHYSLHPTELLFPLDPDFRVLQDAYINSVKEADFIRNGSAKAVMSLSKQDSGSLWKAVDTHDLVLFNTVNTKLLNPPGQSLKNVPIKIYLPSTYAHPDAPQPNTEAMRAEKKDEEDTPQPHAGSVRVVQGLVPPVTGKQSTTLGVALNELLPTVFPSRRNPVIAAPMTHGAMLPMSAGLEDLGRAAAYADGFLHIVVVLLS
ncbi:Autophagy protein 5 [Sphaceloma murrayae]|uniref:Autophagy protein 5 n=1 Tax=Sphaceloma murrayae TaxID=2082308 RepID=A0A2K1QV83_9PEZI|nr:Autophagy protein 5 [Sphaceloma murrayae]